MVNMGSDFVLNMGSHFLFGIGRVTESLRVGYGESLHVE